MQGVNIIYYYIIYTGQHFLFQEPSCSRASGLFLMQFKAQYIFFSPKQSWQKDVRM